MAACDVPTGQPEPAAEPTPSPAEALMGRFFEAGLGALELFTVELGRRLGLYEALAAGPLTSQELAARAEVDHRYVREWANQQAVAGLLTVAGDDLDRRFALVDGLHEVVAEETSPFYLGSLVAVLPAFGVVRDRLVDAYRTGAGIPWSDYPEGAVLQAGFNRSAYVNELVNGWLPEAPDVLARLQASTRPIRVLEVAAGGGWAAIELAKAFPWVTVDGHDVDEQSVLLARRNAEEHQVSDRVRFHLCGLDGVRTEQQYDVAFVFEAIHDMSRPVEVLASIRRALRPDGVLLVADERVEEFTPASDDPVQHLIWASSVLVCLPIGRADEVSAQTGAAMTTETFRSYATSAGFSSVEVLPIEHMVFRFYQARP